jgi:hypothetical protein
MQLTVNTTTINPARGATMQQRRAQCNVMNGVNEIINMIV